VVREGHGKCATPSAGSHRIQPVALDSFECPCKPDSSRRVHVVATRDSADVAKLVVVCVG
jgi:hypothetical protein